MASKLARRGARLVFAIALALLSAVAQGTVAQGETRPVYGKTVVASLLEEPLVVDPVAARSHTDMTIISLLFDTLYRVERGTVVPHLAAHLPDISDPLKVSISLRPGIRFHDGTSLRAQDVVSSLERLRKSDLGFLLEGIKSIRVGAKIEERQLASIVLTLRQADPGLARRLADLHTSIVARGKAPGWRRLVGSGAWRLHQRSARKHTLTLKPFDDHFAGRVYLDSLVLNWYTNPDAEARSYEAGSSHISARGDIAFAGHQPKFATTAAQGEIAALAYLGFGTASPITGEAVFRRAVSGAIGRAGMSQIGSGETVAPTITATPPRQSPRPFALQANAKVASQLLKSLANRYPAVEAKTLALQLLVNVSRPDDSVIAARVAAGLYELGIATRIVSLSADVFARRVGAGDCDLYIGQLAASGSPGLAQLRKAFVVGGKVKMANKLLGQSRAGMERQFATTMPIVPLFHRNLRLHIRSDVKGVAFTETETVDYPGIFIFGDPVKN